jgi:pimeloyl-ACP methyl ester carboxylesterase
MGAAVAGRLLASHPDRLLSVTFGGGGPLLDPPKEFRAVVDATAGSLEKGKGIGPLVIALTPDGQPKPTPEQAEALSGLFLAGKDQEALAAVLRGQRGLEVTAAELKATKVPVRFVYGDLDPLMGAGGAGGEGARQVRRGGGREGRPHDDVHRPGVPQGGAGVPEGEQGVRGTAPASAATGEGIQMTSSMRAGIHTAPVINR